jgi:Helix-turn-helix domain
MRTYSTTQVAKMLKMHQPGLQRLIRHKRIPFPPLVKVGRIAIRLWTMRDVQRARKALAERRRNRRTK